MTDYTTKFVHDLIEKLRELNNEIPGNENLGKEVREFLANYKHQQFAVLWWEDIISGPPELEDKYMRKVIHYATKTLSNEEVGKRMRKFTNAFWKKPGHTMLWTPFHKNIIA